MTAPAFLANKENAFTKLIVTHRQYFTILKDRLTFVYRLGYQSTIDGNAPFYFQPLMISSYSPSTLTEGLGGAKSLRGIMRNRIVGDGFAYMNAEFRYKIAKFIVKKQNVYIALNPFLDAGMVTKRIKSWGTTFGSRLDFHYSGNNEKPHFTTGCGLHIALNENFVLAINYGRALNRQDGKSGLYIGTNWLF
jgi:hemolysin activation/secretion protein